MVDIWWHLLFWGSALALVHSYLLYPLRLKFLARGKIYEHAQHEHSTDCAPVSVLMAVYNEEKVIRQKLDSLLMQEYSPSQLSIWIGSDNSSDQTNSILKEYSDLHNNIHCVYFTDRQGKPNIINQLAAKASATKTDTQHIFLITDASVMLSPSVVFELARHFKTPDIAIVDANMQHIGMAAGDISQSEDHYISWEGRLKYHESVVWQHMIGPFGGCYALRAKYFAPVPHNFLVDDFYITMKVFEQGGLAISAPKAVCYEPVGHQISQEFRRKSRISAGNIQNLIHFRALWWPPMGLPNYAFFSHKVLRWLGPLWLLLLPLAALCLAHNQFYFYTLLLIVSGYVIAPLLDSIFAKMGVHWPLLRHVRYFLTMNLALLAGYIKYLNGVKTNIWQPPARE